MNKSRGFKIFYRLLLRTKRRKLSLWKINMKIKLKNCKTKFNNKNNNLNKTFWSLKSK